MAYHLEPGEPLGAGLTRVAGEQAAAAVQHLSRARKDPATAVHEARKRSKEARAALRLLRADLPAETVRSARAAFRDAARLIAEPRDAEVALQTLEKLRRSTRLLRRDRLPAAAALAARRKAALRRLTRPAVAAVAAAFSAAGAGLPPPSVPDADPASLARVLTRLYRRGRRAMRAAYAGGADEDFHAWRHEAKDLWYAVRLLEPAWPGPLGALAAELRELSALLGDEHDLSMLRAALGGSERGEPPLLTPGLERAIRRRQVALREDAGPLGERVWAEPSRAFGERLGAYWSAWHTAHRAGRKSDTPAQ